MVRDLTLDMQFYSLCGLMVNNTYLLLSDQQPITLFTPVVLYLVYTQNIIFTY